MIHPSLMAFNVVLWTARVPDHSVSLHVSLFLFWPAIALINSTSRTSKKHDTVFTSRLHSYIDNQRSRYAAFLHKNIPFIKTKFVICKQLNKQLFAKIVYNKLQGNECNQFLIKYIFHYTNAFVFMISEVRISVPRPATLRFSCFSSPSRLILRQHLKLGQRQATFLPDPFQLRDCFLPDQSTLYNEPLKVVFRDLRINKQTYYKAYLMLEIVFYYTNQLCATSQNVNSEVLLTS